MDPMGPTPSASSIVASSCISSESAQSTTIAAAPLLEVSLISAQDLAPICKCMRTYAVAWINPSQKLTTQTDQQGHTNPTWDDKFAFRVDNKALNIEIYTASWLRPLLVGTTQVLIKDLLIPPAQNPHDKNYPGNTRFVTLQVRRPSGAPQGILTMGVAFLDSTPLERSAKNNSKIEKNYLDHPKEEDHELDKENLNLYLSRYAKDFPQDPGSICNGGSACNNSAVNDSDLGSDIGPSASVVAAELARKAEPPPHGNGSMIYARVEETGSLVLQELTLEQARAKGYMNNERCGKESTNGSDQSSQLSIYRHSRRKSDKGLFSCFGNSYGIEVRIVCGNNRKKIKA